MTKLFIGGFPLDYTEMQIVQLVAMYGTVSTIKIVRDRKTRKCKGYAFIEMEKEDDAINTMSALNGAELAGRELKLNIVTEQQAAAPKRFSRPQSPRPYAGSGQSSYPRPNANTNDDDKSRRPRLRR